MMYNLGCLSAETEELAQLRAAFFRQHPVHNAGVVIQFGLGEQVDDAAAGPGLGVGGAKHQPRNPGMHNGAGAHAARLQRHVKFASHQPIVADLTCSIPHRNNLCMGGGIPS